MKNLLSLCAYIFIACNSYAAYFQADLILPNSDLKLATHIIIAGKGMEVGDQWLTIAHTQALLFKDKGSVGKIKLIAAIDNQSYKNKIKTWGYTNIKVYEQTFNDDGLLSLISENQSIASLDLIGHNGVGAGLALEDYSNRFFLNSVKKMASLKNKFTSDSYIRLTGCNTGWKLAPALANTLQVPTSGTFSAADIQDVYTQPDAWFYHDVGRYPESAKTTSINTLSFSKPEKCVYGAGCKRLKPVNGAYSGKWGTYDGNIPFQKYFCADLNNTNCAKRMALSMVTQISSVSVSKKPSLDSYARAVADHMCVANKDLNVRKICLNDIYLHVSGKKDLANGYTTMKTTKMVQCDMKSCLYQGKLTNLDINGATYSVELMQAIPQKSAPTTMKIEADYYKLGYSLL